MGGSIEFLLFYGKFEKGDQGVIHRYAGGTLHPALPVWGYFFRAESLAIPKNYKL